MAIAKTVVKHLKQYNVAHEVVQHPRSESSLESARTAHIDANDLAKGVLVKRSNGTYLLTVLPASYDLDVKAVEAEIGDSVEFASEDELTDIFPDCQKGAVPAIGPAYGIDTIVDTRLKQQAALYFEAGDHEELIHVSESQFEKLLKGSRYHHISREIL